MSTQLLKNEVDLHFEQQREQFCQEHRDDDPCRRLWRTVIERSISDLEWLLKIEGRNNLKKHEEEKLRRIEENPPMEFINGPWFETICIYLEIDAHKLRRGVRRRLSKLAQAAA